MLTKVSGVVLAGGQSARFGRDKAVEQLGGTSLITHVITRLSQVATEVIVSVNDESRAEELSLPRVADVVVDVRPDSGSLGGLFSGLQAAAEQWALVVGCDMPFLNRNLLRHMASLQGSGDAVVPMVDGRPEPMHAVYSKSCLPKMEQRLQAGRFAIHEILEELQVRYVFQDELEGFDPGLHSFFNVNTPEDLQRAVALIEEGVV